MKEKVKVLIVMGGSYMGVGGIESMVINYYRNIDKSKVQIDFAFFGDGVGLYDDEIIANGGRLFHLPIKTKHYIKSVCAMKRLLKRENYDIVHANLNAAGIKWSLKIAKQCGVKVRISHAHGANHGTQNKIRWLLNDLSRMQITKYATHNVACSDLAGDWYYGTKAYTLVRNAVNTKPFLYNEETRKAVRATLQAEGKFVVGHVGNLGYPKNQSFLLDIFAKVVAAEPASELWLIGEGEDLTMLQDKAAALGIDEKVKFLGRRADVNQLMQGMDVFVLPSFFEGFPVVITEAVTADLPCIVSDSVTKMVKISDKVEMLNINSDPGVWCDRIVSYRGTNRRNNQQLIKDSGFDICVEAKKLENFYLNGRFE